MLHRILIATFAVIILTMPAMAIHGAISGTWGPGGTYVIDGNCWILAFTTLTILEDVTVEFETNGGPYEIWVQGEGHLTAGEANGSPVIFTSDGSPPLAGDWGSIRAICTHSLYYDSTAYVTLVNCEISYGGVSENPHHLDYPDGVVQSWTYTNVSVTDCYIHNNLGSGVSSKHNGYNRFTVENCVIDSCSIGIKCMVSDNFPSSVARNLITKCDLGMRLFNSPAAPICNNIIHASIDTGVVVLGTTNPFYNNVVDSSGDDGIRLYSGFEGCTIENNIIVNNAGYGIAQRTGTGDVEYNDVWNNTRGNYLNLSAGTGAISSDPQFVGVVSGNPYDYHLKWNSLCLGAGTGTNNNTASSTADMGAYGGEGVNLDDYWVGITGGEVSGTLDQDASPYHVFADFTNPVNHALTIVADGFNCELLFAENTGLTVYEQLNLRGQNSSHKVVMNRLGTTGHWDGITMAVGSAGDFGNTNIGYAEDGVYIDDAEVTMDTCRVEDCNDEGVYVQYADFWMAHSRVLTNYGTGLFIYDGTAKLVLDSLLWNNDRGIYVQYYASVRADNTLPGNYPGFNDIEVNHGAEIELKTNSTALMHNGHNNVVDERDQEVTLMKTSDYSQVSPYDVEQNWWGTVTNLSTRFDPSNMFDYDPWDTHWNTHPAWFDPDLAWEAFSEAAELENAGSYSEAIEAYKGVIEDFPEASVAHESLSRIFYVTDVMEGDFDELVTYYQGMVDSSAFEPLALFSYELQTRSLVKAHEFQEALDRYEAIVANPPSLQDSVYAVIGVGYVYLAAEAAGGNLASLGPIGIFPALKPTSYADYRQRCDELLALISSDGKPGANGENAIMPMGFSLAEPYPNPFNASVRISYTLTEARDVHLMVYDILGRRVNTLVDNRQQAGNHSVIWSGQSFSGVPVSSGLYFVRMQTETGAMTAKLLLLK